MAAQIPVIHADGSSMTMRGARSGPTCRFRNQEGRPVPPLRPSARNCRAKRKVGTPGKLCCLFAYADDAVDHRRTLAADTLAEIYTLDNAGQPTGDIFRGERDGCATKRALVVATMAQVLAGEARPCRPAPLPSRRVLRPHARAAPRARPHARVW